jgi:lysophospholipase L1-like esterase
VAGLAAAVAACGEASLTPVPQAPADADVAPGVDAGAAPEDAGFTPDAAPPPPEDAGVAPDAAPPPPDDAGQPEPDAGAPEVDAGVPLAERCFADIFDPARPGPDYDQFMPTYADHCLGTNHQDITGVERVVFIGDSVTVGSPPTLPDEFYRSRLADQLAARFNLDAPSAVWKRASYANGTALIQESGDFASCAKWGARTDDLMEDNSQVQDCLPEDQRHLRTLVVLTIGGNDIASITKNGAPSGGRTLAQVTAQTEEFVQKLQDAVAYIKTPGLFPNGVFVVFGNMYEFTDATGDVSSCPAAGLAGFDEAWANPADLEHLVVWANEQYMRIAVETGADMIFMLEHFCGHGYHNEDPAGRCYRGPNTPRWFDATCIHPNPTGHQVLADMFMAVVDE